MRIRFFVIGLMLLLSACGEAQQASQPTTEAPQSVAPTEAADQPTNAPTIEVVPTETPALPSASDPTPAEAAGSESRMQIEAAGFPAPPNSTSYSAGSIPLVDSLIAEAGNLPSVVFGSQAVTQKASTAYVSQASLDELQSFYSESLSSTDWAQYRTELSNELILGYMYAGPGDYDVAQIVIVDDPSAEKNQDRRLIIISIGTAE